MSSFPPPEIAPFLVTSPFCTIWCRYEILHNSLTIELLKLHLAIPHHVCSLYCFTCFESC